MNFYRHLRTFIDGLNSGRIIFTLEEVYYEA